MPRTLILLGGMLYDACGAVSLPLAAALAYYVNLRRRRRSLQREIEKVKQRMAARRRAALARFVMLAASRTDQRRHVERASGKWRGSTLSGYLRGDDQTYVENFRMTRETFNKLLSLLAASEFALSGGMPGQGVPGTGGGGASSKRSDWSGIVFSVQSVTTRIVLSPSMPLTLWQGVPAGCGMFMICGMHKKGGLLTNHSEVKVTDWLSR